MFRIFRKKNKPSVRFVTDFLDDYSFYKLMISRNSYHEDYIWYPTFEDKADYTVVFQQHQRTSKVSGRRIWTSFEPSVSFTKQFKDGFLKSYYGVIYHNIDAFDEQLKNSKIRFTESPMWLPWYTKLNTLQISQLFPKKKKKLSVVISGKNILPERDNIYDERKNFVRMLFDTEIEFDFYGSGHDNLYDHDVRFKGPVRDKYEALKDYEFSIAIENSREKNYISEKFYDPINCLTVPIYYGCPNLKELIQENAFVELNTLTNVNFLVENINSLDYNGFLENLQSVKSQRLRNDFFSTLNNFLLDIK